MIKVGILGAAGYTGGELIRLLINHPQAEIVFANSESNAGNPVAEVHEGLLGETSLRFSADMPFEDIDVLFFCFGHGKSEQFLSEHNIPERVRIIDLAQDFRVKQQAPDCRWSDLAVYGLPEINREAIRSAHFVANPGCFATAIQLGLLPLAAHGLLTSDISVNAITGSTGAGVKPSATTHFSWRSGNISIYKAFRHQHLAEIRQSLTQLQSDFGASIDFIPYRGDFPRGIFCTELVRLSQEISEESIADIYRQFYADAVFTHYVERALDLKQVVNTNKALLHIEKYEDKLLVTSIIDNLLKGASGQALQNMNIMFGLPEDTGLKLKSLAF
ncbi:MAG: N-acetyl-gamma-glutamyl-phosphate reductase [Bacteroidaceae bacterium]|nr:N-acetyl-gamma-glutamyl-phosphate reductase [Bacteroidaceae bacterium]